MEHGDGLNRGRHAGAAGDSDVTPLGGGMPSPGSAAPELSLLDQYGCEFRLSQHRGHWVVVYFYQHDGAPGCVKEAQDFAAAYTAFTLRGIEVVGISIDTVESHRRFAERLNLPFRLLADPDAAVSKRYGVYVKRFSHGRPYWGVRRTTFLIDPRGEIAKVFAGVKPVGHAAAVVAAIDDLVRNGNR